MSKVVVRLAMLSLLALVGCARGAMPDGEEPDPADADPGVIDARVVDVVDASPTDAPRDVRPVDAPVAMDAGFDATLPMDVGFDVPVAMDVGFDVPVAMDVGFDVPVAMDAGFDVPVAMDAPPPRDVGVDTGTPACAPSMCPPGAGNACCLGGCGPMGSCLTTAGLCADQCDANRLRTARTCQGCGAAGAVGVCGGGGEFVCDASEHSLCRAIMCGGQTFTCTNDGGAWQWRSAARCDDGDACTHSDACGGGQCRGTAVACPSDACMTRACNGTASCTQTPHPGVDCDDGNAMTNRDVCSAAGVCTGTVVCALPTDACGDGAQSRDGCGNARIIGRRTAASTAGFVVSANTCSARNRFDDCAWDAGADHAYRIWARTGETVSAAVTRGEGCVNLSWDATLKLYQGGDCGTVTCSGDRWCRSFVGSGPQTWVAARDGWIVVVVDGSTAFDDEGTYTLRVRLSGCAAAGCDCP